MTLSVVLKLTLVLEPQYWHFWYKYRKQSVVAKRIFFYDM